MQELDKNKKKVFVFTLVLGVMLGLMAFASVGFAAADGYTAIGAGTTADNGLYCPVGVFNGAVKYQNENLRFLNYYTAGVTATLWAIGSIDNNDAGNVDYYHSVTPEGAYSISGGASAAPTVVASPGECGDIITEGIGDKATIYFFGIIIFGLGYYMMRQV